VFIRGGNPHLTSRFCGVVLNPTTISKTSKVQVFIGWFLVCDAFRIGSFVEYNNAD